MSLTRRSHWSNFTPTAEALLQQHPFIASCFTSALSHKPQCSGRNV
ncbi:hypothetical protein [Desulfocastanea catecholica]